MTELEQEKLKQEIKSLKASRFADLLKALAFVLGAVVLFIAIRIPESILNKQSSKETINRERAKLIYEVIHNDTSYDNVILEITVIEKAYPADDSKWLEDIKSLYKTKIEKKQFDQQSKFKGLKNTPLKKMEKDLDSLYSQKLRLQTSLVGEISGQSGSHAYGRGPVAQAIEHQITEIDTSIKIALNRIDILRKAGSDK